MKDEEKSSRTQILVVEILIHPVTGHYFSNVILSLSEHDLRHVMVRRPGPCSGGPAFYVIRTGIVCCGDSVRLFRKRLEKFRGGLRAQKYRECRIVEIVLDDIALLDRRSGRIRGRHDQLHQPAGRGSRMRRW